MDWSLLLSPGVLGSALVLAAVASAESLLTAVVTTDLLTRVVAGVAISAAMRWHERARALSRC